MSKAITKITFCGHKEVSDEKIIFNNLIENLETLFNIDTNTIADTQYIFYCGGYGAFDRLAARAIDILRTKHPDIKTEKIFVTPYITPNYQETNSHMKKYYDDVVYPPLENVPLKFAISRRNEWMVDNSDIVIAYVTHSWGGAAKTLSYAKRKHKQIISIFD